MLKHLISLQIFQYYIRAYFSSSISRIKGGKPELLINFSSGSPERARDCTLGHGQPEATLSPGWTPTCSQRLPEPYPGLLHSCPTRTGEDFTVSLQASIYIKRFKSICFYDGLSHVQRKHYALPKKIW